MSSASTTDDGKHTQTDVEPLQQVGGEDTETVSNTFKPCTVAAKFLDITIQYTKFLQSFEPEIVVDSCKFIVKKLILHCFYLLMWKACNVPEAVALLKEFDAGIDVSQPVTKYPIPAPSHHMVPYDTSTHTVLAVQLNLQLHHSILQNVLDT